MQKNILTQFLKVISSRKIEGDEMSKYLSFLSLSYSLVLSLCPLLTLSPFLLHSLSLYRYMCLYILASHLEGNAPKKFFHRPFLCNIKCCFPLLRTLLKFYFRHVQSFELI